MRTHLLALGLLAPAACAPAAIETICTMEARSSFAVTVVDSASGQNLAPTATVRVTAGTFSDTLVALPPDSLYSGVHERPGEYAMAVTRSGYQPWQRSGVEVGRDECHVITHVDTARLRRQQ